LSTTSPFCVDVCYQETMEIWHVSIFELSWYMNFKLERKHNILFSSLIWDKGSVAVYCTVTGDLCFLPFVLLFRFASRRIFSFVSCCAH
jgi:hypothetical protein